MELSDLKEQLEKDLNRGVVSPQVLLDRFIMIDEDFRHAPAYVDTHNYPFYYHLGKLIKPKRLLEVGFGVGLATGCLFRSCKSVEDALLIHVKNDKYYNPYIGVKNLRSVYRCKYFVHVMPIEIVIENIVGPFDLAIVNEAMNFDNYRNILDRIFEVMSLDGLIVANFMNDKSREAFQATAKVHNRDYVIIKTRYGTGVLKK